MAFGAYQRGFFGAALQAARTRLAANPNDAAALTLLGQLHTEGVATPRDLGKAADFFKRAADLGDPNAAFALGVALFEGRGVRADRAQAQSLFERAAAKNHPGALYNLAIMAIERPVPDYAAAADLFRRSAEAGGSDGAYTLGVLYHEGRGVPRDDTEALRWLKRAADDGNVPAMVEYAIMLFNGQGAERDEAMAARYFLKAAQRNNPVAQNRAARLLAAGRGVAPDLVEAMKWHLLARSAGLGDAWLDDRLTGLTQAQRSAVEEAVRRYNGS